MARFTTSLRFKELIECSSLEEDEKRALLSSNHITHTNLVNFYRRCHPTESLLDLVRLCRLDFPSYKPETKPKSPEFVRSMELLRLKAQEEEYQRLVDSSPDVGPLLYEQSRLEKHMTPAQMHKEVKSHITTIFNIAISVGSVVYAIWYWTESSMRLKDSYRVLMCIFFGLLVLVAEVVVYLGYLNKIEVARARESQQKEVKKLIKSVT
jgi:hypothetical protein